MTRELRRAHRLVWAMNALLIAALIVAATLVRRP